MRLNSANAPTTDSNKVAISKLSLKKQAKSMVTKNIPTLEELFTELINNHNLESSGLNSQQVVQLQGQIEEGLGLLNDVIDELRTIDPEAVSAIKALTLQIFE